MRKTKLYWALAAIVCVTVLTGCQKAPEVSEDNGIWHAQSTVEQQVSNIAGEAAGQQSGGVFEGTIGTTDNKMHISAEIPAIPENVYMILLKPNDGLDKDTLTAFLDSASGNIADTSQELLDSIEKSDYDNTHDTGDGIFLYSKFGDHSALQLNDSEKVASFDCHTGVDYRDSKLLDKISAISQSTATSIAPDQMDTGSGFTAKEAEQILLDKLEVLGITEISVNRIWLNDGIEYSYYDLDFVPSYEGIEMISELSWSVLGEIYPHGYAMVTQEGVAMLGLNNFCGKIANKEPVTILSFEQIGKILEQYLDSNRILADERITMSNIKLEYFPLPNTDITYEMHEIEYRPELKLIPVWHIYMPLEDYIDAGCDSNVPYNICINAVTGEIERVW